MNNAIKDIKITLEGRVSRIRETEDRISKVEDKMVEINKTYLLFQVPSSLPDLPWTSPRTVLFDVCVCTYL